VANKVLFVDDEPNVLSAYKRNLHKRFQMDTALSGIEALELVATNGPYAVVISDMGMPGMDGMKLLTILKKFAPDTVRIMLTGYADQKVAVDAVNQGQVFKFLNKPCSPEDMAAVIESGISQYNQAIEITKRLARSSAEVRGLTEKLSYQAKHDLFTGLANRHTFEAQLQLFLESAQHEGREHALGFLDVDHFHIINDTCGHVAGDELLRQLAQQLASQQRNGDLLARLAGDEFGIMLADCPLEEAKRIITERHKKLKHFQFKWEDKQFDTCISIGLAPINQESVSVAAVLSAAETACNVAKNQGRNIIHVGDTSDPEMTDRMNEVQWVNRINEALLKNRFCLYYQTIAPVAENTCEGDHYELLVRMQGENGEIIPPGEFLPAAENYYLSPKLDRWVIQHAANWLSSNPERLEKLSLCNINLSGHSFSDKDMLNFILTTFDQASIPPEKICFEVTETAAIAHLNHTISFIKELKSKGFLFALDDFGSGLSSFAYLKNLPVDILKIDGIFVKTMDIDEFDQAMVKSISEIGQVMGKKTVAEFVENQEILQLLRKLKVDYAQGYHIAKPQPLDDLK